MYRHPKWLPTRRDINTYFYAILEYLGNKGCGTTEALNLVFWGPAVPLTVGWALARLWAPYWHHWEFGITAFYVTHLISGLIMYIVLAKGAENMPTAALKKRAAWTLIQAFFGYFCAVALTLFTAFIFLFSPSSAPVIINPVNGVIVALCFVITAYVGLVAALYRKYPAYRVEGLLGLFELFLWTAFILATGGCQSPFFFAYFLPLISVFRRGFTESVYSDPRYRRTDREGALTSLFGRMVDWHNHTWVSFVLYPFFWLIVTQVAGAVLCVALNASGICGHDKTVESWALVLATNLGRFYLNGAPYLFVLVLMAITLELETDSARVLGQLMKKKAMEDWTRNLSEVVTELSGIIKENYMFNCSSILAATFVERAGGAEYEAEKLYLGEVGQQSVSELFPARRVYSADKVSEALGGLLRGTSEQVNPDAGIFRDYYYYLEEAREKKRFKQSLEPLSGLSPSVGRFWQGAKSLCYVVFPHPNRKDKEIKKYTVIFFKSALPGEFDATSAKLYEAIFTQVSGILGKYEEFEEVNTVRKTSENIADLAMTLTHDFKKQADRLYINLGKTGWMEKAPGKAGREWNSQLSAYLLYRRLSLVDEVARYTSPLSGRKKLFECIRDTPDERTLEVVKAIAQACWLTPALASEGEDISLNGGAEFIRSLSWNTLQRSKDESWDDWKDILKQFFAEIGPDFFTATRDAAFKCAKSPEGQTNITTDLWVLVFHEIARNSVKGKVLSRWLNASREGDKLVIEWTSYFGGGETEARTSWGVDKSNPFPPEGKPSMPAKPQVPGPGWGQYGNYVVVQELLESEYEVLWKLHPSLDQFSWTTRIRINSEILSWE
jgi:hypothetical protein